MLQNFWVKWFLFAAGLTVTSSLNAQDQVINVNWDLFASHPNDKSVEYLGMIFGGRVGAIQLGSNPPNFVLGKMFETLNTVVVAVGVSVLSYITLVSTINSAGEGSFMGKKWSSLWIPIRSILGMLLMVPSAGNGYSLVQVTVMWVILQGVGAANSIWDTWLTMSERGFGLRTAQVGRLGVDGNSIQTDLSNLMKSQIDKTQLQKLMEDMLKANICMAYVNTIPKPSGPSGNALRRAGNISISNSQASPSSVTLNYRGSDNKNYCGRIVIDIPATNQDSRESVITAVLAANTALRYTANRIVNNFERNTNISEKSERAFKSVSASDFRAFEAAKTAYFNGLAIGVKPIARDINQDVRDQYDQLRENGWIHAGSFYYKLSAATTTQSLEELPEEVRRVPAYSFSEEPLVKILNEDKFKELPIIQANAVNRIKKIQEEIDAENNKKARGLRNMNSFSTGVPGEDEVKAITSFFDQIGSFFTGEYFQFGEGGLNIFMDMLVRSNPTDPLISISAFGSKLMQIAELTSIAIIATSFAAAVTLSIGACANPGFMVAVGIYGVAVSVVMFFVMLWVVGALLGFMVPMIPYLIFSITALSWFIAVAEAVVAAPILALGLVLPQGEELGKAAAGIQVLANVFLRPMLMIVGFAVASTVLIAVINMINFGFQTSIREFKAAGGMPQSVFLSLFLPLIMYTGIVLAFINKSFALIYIIPDKTLRWMGVAPDSTDEAKIMQDVQGKYDQGSSAAGETMKGAASGASGKLADTAEKKFKGVGGSNDSKNPPGTTPDSNR